MDSIVAPIGEIFGPVAGLILALAVVLGGAAMWLQDRALKAPGPDRDRLLRSLEVGGDLRQLYVFWLTRGLNRVDRFLGDADKAAFSLPSPFRNREPAPYWTGWSFDVCALLALVYPLLGVFAGWVWTGDAGVVGRGLGMSAAPPMLRGVAAFGVVAIAFAFRQMTRGDGRRQALWVFVGFAAAFAFAVAFGIAATTVVFGAFGFSFVVAFPRAGAGARAVAFAVAGTSTFAGAGAGAGVFAASVAFFVAFVIAHAIAIIASRAAEKNRLGRFWLAFWPIAVGLCYLLLWGSVSAGVPSSPMLLIVMVGLVALVNIPFDWTSIGVTRALLRRGCELEAWWPFLLGVADFLLGLLLLGLLAVALLTALLVADHVTTRAGVAPLIDLPRLFHRLATTPESAANWWVYLTLFSTMLPSVLNCLIGAVSLISWSLPSLRRWMLVVIPTLGEGGLDITRKLVLLALGGQVFFGTLLTGGALWGLVLGAEAIAPFALSDLLAGAEVWVRTLQATGHV